MKFLIMALNLLVFSFPSFALDFEMGTDIMNPVFYNLGFTQKQTNDVRFGVHLKERFA